MGDRLREIRALAIDLDGVVYHGDQLIRGADSAVAHLRELGLRVLFVTNNSSKSRQQIAEKLTWLGISASEREVFNSAHATAVLLERLSDKTRATAFIIGSQSLKTTIEDIGISTVDSPPADFLVVGLDNHITYEKISKALDAVLSGAVFIACNRDNSYPAEERRLLPGCGAIVAAVEAACGRSPDHIAGKPETLMLQILSRTVNLNPGQILVVGDSVSSDIEMAHRFGSPSVLVSEAKNVSAKRKTARSTVVIDSLARLPRILLKGSDGT
jgi:HAD superfamily hydrolase (TIGR01450 family)